MVVYKYGNDSIGGELNCNGEKEIKNVFLYTINRDPSNDEMKGKLHERNA